MSVKKTGAAPTTPKRKHQSKTYRRYELRSRTKIKDDIGELLWSLQFSIEGDLEQAGWQTLERLLRRYIGVMHTRSTNDGRKRE
jgi:hypothetical protein